MSVIFHIDVNSAFLSWSAVEELKKGSTIDLREVPSIVGGDQKSRHGVVLAKSTPAKKYGIRTGEPVANAFRKCPKLLMVKPEHGIYSRYSRELMAYLETISPLIQQMSVDECYLDMTAVLSDYESPEAAAQMIRREVKERFGFTVNVGISTRKILAKMASDFTKPDRTHTLFPEEIEEKMWPLPVEELYMVGRSSVKILKNLEINTIGDLAKTDIGILELHLKKHGRKMWEYANGYDESKVKRERQEAKNVGNSTTLSADAVTLDEVQKILAKLAEKVATRLQKKGQKAGNISVEIRYHDFTNVSHQRQLENHTSEAGEIYQIAAELFERIWDKEPVRLLGIRTSKLVDASEPEQLTLGLEKGENIG